MGRLMGGAIIIEQMFALPGVGQLLVESIYQQEYLMTQGIVLFVATMFIVINLADRPGLYAGRSAPAARRRDTEHAAHAAHCKVVVCLAGPGGRRRRPTAQLAADRGSDQAEPAEDAGAALGRSLVRRRLARPRRVLADHLRLSDHASPSASARWPWGCCSAGALGIVAGYFRGAVERTILMGVNVLLAFPPLVLIIAMVAYPGEPLLKVILGAGHRVHAGRHADRPRQYAWSSASASSWTAARRPSA